MKFKIELDQEEREIEVTRQGDQLKISLPEETVTARLIHTDGPYFVLEVSMPGEDQFVQRRQIRAVGYKDGEQRQLWANGRLVQYRHLRPGAAAQQAAAGSLAASIPAVVSEILVAAGDQVEAGQQLILLESMKMILPIKAPHEGIVTEINCQPGEAVQPGVQLLSLEKDG